MLTVKPAHVLLVLFGCKVTLDLSGFEALSVAMLNGEEKKPTPRIQDEHATSTRGMVTTNLTETNADDFKVDLVEKNNGTGNKLLPLAEIEIVVGHCRDDLRYLDLFPSCDRIHIHIYSPCGGSIPVLENVADCVTVVTDAGNYGRETYAYFDFIQRRYDSLPEMTAFLQGSAYTENPHVAHDVLHYLPGTTYASLSRNVRGAWHLGKHMEKRRTFLERGTPHLLNQTTWVTGWRSQFLASRETLRSVPRQLFADLNQAMRDETCGHPQCGLETWLGPLFGCAEYALGANATIVRYENRSLTVFPSDFLKDSSTKGRPVDAPHPRVANHITQVTAGKKILLYSESTINGLFTCLNFPSSHHLATEYLLPPPGEDLSSEPRYRDERKRNGERLIFVRQQSDATVTANESSVL